MDEDLGSNGPDMVAVLGTGIMGAAMARNLLRAHVPTVVWNRTTSTTDDLAEAGASVAATPADAVRRARVVITMLPTAAVVRSVLFDGDTVNAFASGAVWAQMGTIGIDETEGIAARLRELRGDVLFVDAPVSGSKGPAESGELVVLASGPTEAEPILEPAFSAIGRKTVWLGPAGQGMRMKLVVNAYLAAVVEGLAETLELADRLGVDQASFGETINGGPLDAPIAAAKRHKMEVGDFSAEFPLEWALKDVDLAIDAAPGTPLPMLTALSRQWHGAVGAGHGREDISAARAALQASDPARR